METRTALTSQQLTHMATDLRLACMRISRRVRFESSHDVAPHQFSVLCRLEETPRTPGELADIERVAKPSMTRTVGALVERGLVLRQPDPTDGRQVILSITDEGRRSVRAIRRKRDAWMASRVVRLTAEEQDVLVRATAILAKVAGE
jgi:DNA-binding MarR family transcriptional regulator